MAQLKHVILVLDKMDCFRYLGLNLHDGLTGRLRMKEITTAEWRR